MTSCRDKLYYHIISNKIEFNFLIILFGKMFSGKFLPSSDAESEIKKMTDFEKFGLLPYLLEPTKSKVPVAYDRNSVSDLASSNDVDRNVVIGRIGNKNWCKCGCCALMDTSIEGVCFLETPEIWKRRFSSTSCSYVFLSDLHIVVWYSRRKNFFSYLNSTQCWSLANQNKRFLSLQTLQLSFSVKHFTILFRSFSLQG